MALNVSGAWTASLANSSSSSSSSLCGYNSTSWEQRMNTMYTYFYLALFIPGLLLNTTALWVLCRHISKRTKAVIFMINLALADLAHILSLPLRIYYYFTHSWPFGRGVCLFCFYLKYLNMYAAIVFLVCISVQRCVFLLNPFSARRWRRRYDLLISIIVWLVVGLACSPFILMRSSGTSAVGAQTADNASYYLTTQHPSAHAKPPSRGCFKDLPTRRLPVSMAITMMAFAELFGFVLPLACISISSVRIVRSLNQKQAQGEQQASGGLSSSGRGRPQPLPSGCHADKHHEKRRALWMVLSCSALFLICFAPYHVNFLLYLMVSQDIVSHCATRAAVWRFHPLSLCLASLSSCLNPLLYYFATAEFRSHLSRRTSSFTASLLSSPISWPTPRPAQHRLASMESSGSDKQRCDMTSEPSV